MIAAIENAILAQLQAAGENGGPLGYAYRTLATYPDEFAQYLRDNSNLRTPAAWAVFLGLPSGIDAGTDAGWAGVARFALVVAAQDLRNDQDTRHGSGSQPGSYQLMIDAIRLLSQNDLGLDVEKALSVRSARLVTRTEEMKRQRLSLIAIELECTVPFGSFDEDHGPFDTLHVDWDVPPFGIGAPPLPADNPDAEDLIEVPQ